MKNKNITVWPSSCILSSSSYQKIFFFLINQTQSLGGRIRWDKVGKQSSWSGLVQRCEDTDCAAGHQDVPSLKLQPTVECLTVGQWDPEGFGRWFDVRLCTDGTILSPIAWRGEEMPWWFLKIHNYRFVLIFTPASLGYIGSGSWSALVLPGGFLPKWGQTF